MKTTSLLIKLMAIAFLAAFTGSAGAQIVVWDGGPSGSCVRQVLQKGLEVLFEVGVLVGSRTGCGA